THGCARIRERAGVGSVALRRATQCARSSRCCPRRSLSFPRPSWATGGTAQRGWSPGRTQGLPRENRGSAGGDRSPVVRDTPRRSRFRHLSAAVGPSQGNPDTRRGVPLALGPAPPLSVHSGAPTMLERDSFGNADGSACSRFGTTIAFDAATIASWYPDHRSYVAAVDRAARRAVARGVLIAVDA